MKLMKDDLFNILKESSYKQLDIQNSSVESIEAKTTSLLSVVMGVPTVLITIYSISKITIEWNYFLTFGGILLLFSLFFIVRSLVCRDFSLPAEVEPFLNENENLGINSIRINFLDDCRKAINFNILRIKNKGKAFNKGLILFVISMIMIIIGIIVGGSFNMTDNQQQTNNKNTPPLSSPSPTEGKATPQVNTNSGLPSNRQGTTINVFKGADTPPKK
jgi:hypothetical protein